LDRSCSPWRPFPEAEVPSSAWEVASATADDAAKRDTERQRKMLDTMRSGTTERTWLGEATIAKGLRSRTNSKTRGNLLGSWLRSWPRSGFESIA
jgi:hypothetical protein